MLPKLLKVQPFTSAIDKVIQRLQNVLSNPRLKSVGAYVLPVLIAERMDTEFIQSANAVWSTVVSSLQNNFE